MLQGVPGNQAARQPLHQPLLHDAGLRHARAAVFRRHCLYQKDPGLGQNGAGGPRLLHEADERRSPWRLDNQDGLDLPHNPATCHELRVKGSGNKVSLRTKRTARSEQGILPNTLKPGQCICQRVTLKHGQHTTE